MLHDISIGLHANQVSAFIGPSGCGKSTFLRTLNRMNDIIAGTRVEGDILIDDENIYAGGTDVVDLRRRVGMVFQKSNPFPKSIFENVAYGIRINGMATRPRRPRAARRGEPPARRALGRGEGPAARVGAGACREGSSSGCASRARSPCGRRSC